MNKTFFKSILFVGLAACMFSCKDDNSPLDGGNTAQLQISVAYFCSIGLYFLV